MDDPNLTLVVDDGGIRLDKLLAAHLDGISRSAIQDLIADGCVTAGGRHLVKSAKLSAGL